LRLPARATRTIFRPTEHGTLSTARATRHELRRAASKTGTSPRPDRRFDALALADFKELVPTAAETLDDLINPHWDKRSCPDRTPWAWSTPAALCLVRTRGDSTPHWRGSTRRSSWRQRWAPPTRRVSSTKPTTLLQRDAPGDREKAAALLREALAAKELDNGDARRQRRVPTRVPVIRRRARPERTEAV
jgi:hypothetical protein